MRLTSIIIPTFNGLPLLQRCVSALRRHTKQDQTPYEIIVVDNGSTDGTAAWCCEERLRLIALPANYGFPHACNAGLRLASGDSLLLLNNDVTVTARWLDNLQAALYSQPMIGMVGPITNFASGRQQVKLPFHDMREFERIAKQMNSDGTASSWEPIDRLVGFCLLFKRELYERIGELDTQFSPGHYEDDDYCFRARMQGWRLLMCRNSLVHHAGSASFGREAAEKTAALVERNRALFIEKWQVDPAIFVANH